MSGNLFNDPSIYTYRIYAVYLVQILVAIVLFLFAHC